MMNSTVEEMEVFFSKYKNTIGVAVFIMLLTLSAIFIYTHIEQKKMAENCGFDDGKIKCVCNNNAWNDYQIGLDEETEFPKDLNSNKPLKKNNG